MFEKSPGTASLYLVFRKGTRAVVQRGQKGNQEGKRKILGPGVRAKGNRVEAD